MIKPTFCLFYISCLAAIMRSGCAKLTTPSATFKIESSDFEKLEVIVHSVFLEMGFHNEGDCFKERRCSYRIRGEKNKEGSYSSYKFEVKYNMINEQIVILIKNTLTKGSEAKSRKVNEYLSKIIEQINKRLQEMNLKAIVETKSYWVPSPYK